MKIDTLMFTTCIFPSGPYTDWACNLHPVKYDIKFWEILVL